MTIRTKLTLQFVSIVALIIFLSSIAVYFFSANYREENFHDRLYNKANNTAKLLITVDEIDADLLKKIEEANPVSLPNEKIIIYNYKNEVLFTTDKNAMLNIDTHFLDKIRLEKEVRFKKGEYEALGFLFTDQYDRFVVIAVATDIYGFRKLNNLQWILLTVFGCSILVASFFGWVYSGRALRPISEVITQVNEISISKLNLRVDEGNQKDEIAQLAQTFNRMLSRLESAFKTQKNFIANASHELRTPLTAITGQLDVVQMKERDTGEYKQVLASVSEDIKNLNSISNRLLLLAQTDSDYNIRDFTPIRIDEIVWQSQAELLKRDSTYRINVNLAGDMVDESNFLVRGNEHLIKTALINLMDNACKYSLDKTVEVYLSNDVNIFEITFSDKGIGIPEADLPHIFQPFHRAQNAILFKGHGIGLSLVSRIISIHGGSIQVKSQLGEGSIFTLKLPNC